MFPILTPRTYFGWLIHLNGLIHVWTEWKKQCHPKYPLKVTLTVLYWEFSIWVHMNLSTSYGNWNKSTNVIFSYDYGSSMIKFNYSIYNGTLSVMFKFNRVRTELACQWLLMRRDLVWSRQERNRRNIAEQWRGVSGQPPVRLYNQHHQTWAELFRIVCAAPHLQASFVWSLIEIIFCIICT